MKVTAKRLWRLRLATQELLREGRADGRLIERLVGHYTFVGLLRRGLLSVFQATYALIRKQYTTQCWIWPEVRRELFWASSLLCLIRKGMSIPWSTKVHATDASHWGRGVVSGDREVADIRVIGGVCDRWRFSRESESLIAGMPDPVQEGEGETDGSFSLATPRAEQETLGFSGEVPLDFIGTGWQKVDSAPWSRDEPIAVLEGRVLVWLGQHLARSTKNHDRKHLVLTDSMTPPWHWPKVGRVLRA